MKEKMMILKASLLKEKDLIEQKLAALGVILSDNFEPNGRSDPKPPEGQTSEIAVSRGGINIKEPNLIGGGTKLPPSSRFPIEGKHGNEETKFFSAREFSGKAAE